MDRTIEQFSDELMDLLTAAAQKAIIVQVPNRSKAVSLRYRLYHLRKKLAQANLPQYKHLLRTQANILLNGEPYNYALKNKPIPPPNSVWEVVCCPADQDIAAYIRTALNDQAPDLPKLTDAPSLAGITMDTLPEGAGEPEPEIE